MSTVSGTPAADEAESRKQSKYAELLDNFLFQPVAFETLGGVGSSSRKFIAALGKRVAAATSDSNATKFLRQRLALAVQVGNAAAVLETVNFT